jgi:hypothetical protein
VAEVHSVFERACNFALADGLITLLTPLAAPAPPVMVLAPALVAPGESLDLRACFDVGEPLRGTADGVARTPRVRLLRQRAAIWQPSPPRLGASTEQVARRCRRAHEQRRLRGSSRLGGSGFALQDSGVPQQLQRACRALDHGAAKALVDRLVGWGEGLTPAGDDLLVGCLAALQVQTGESAARQAFLAEFGAAVGAAIATSPARTTRIAAEALRLALEGHHGATLLAARDALLGEVGVAGADGRDGSDRAAAGSGEDGRAVTAALSALLALGASSGADLALGLLLGIEAWATAGDEAA